ncbi:sensor histidine kinase [Flaviaesturariibacter terrae]
MNTPLSIAQDEKSGAAVETSYDVAFLNKERQKLLAELALTRLELAFQLEQNERRGRELAQANRELLRQNNIKERRASELAVANEELAYQNHEKERRASELAIANEELAYQNHEKERRAAELHIANIELAYQNVEKEKRAAELLDAIKELEAFAFVSSHDLQEPLRKMLVRLDQLSETSKRLFDEKEQHRFDQVLGAAHLMRQMIQDLYVYSRVNTAEHRLEAIALAPLVAEVRGSFVATIREKEVLLETGALGEVLVDVVQFRLLLRQLLGNALKFTAPGRTPHIRITAGTMPGIEVPGGKLSACPVCSVLSISDNGIGFAPEFKDRIFEVFQRLHGREDYDGTGIGLAIVKKVVEAHRGVVVAEGAVNEGATFTVYLPMAVGAPR